MSAIANRYKRGELVGIGFEADFGGCRCHCIAWENAQVERLRDDPVFTEGLIIDQIIVDQIPSPLPSKITVEVAVPPQETPDSVPPPEVIATHETIEPAISETPVEPIQEPVAGVSELTASPPAQAPDTPAEASWAPTPGDSEAATIRSYLKQFGDLPSESVIDALAEFGVVVTSSQVLVAKKARKQ